MGSRDTGDENKNKKNTMQMYVEGGLSHQWIDGSCCQMMMLIFISLSKSFQELHALQRLHL